jgi:DNA repair protein SbcD/Mre11
MPAAIKPMKFTFLHAADLHLGSPFVGLALRDEEVAQRFAKASRDAFSDLITRAIDASVAFVVIAGDIYDGDWKDTSIGLFFNREIARLERVGIGVFILKGNHDAESVITKTISLPDNVYQFPARTAATARIEELKVALHGRSFPERAVTENYVLDYPNPISGWFNVGVLHTSCDGRPGHAPYAPCTVPQLKSLGYQYWALGHVHEYEELAWDPWIVFPGNIQGRSIRECGPKGAVLVDVEDTEVVNVQRVIVDRARWATLTVDLAGVLDEAVALRTIEEQIRPVAAEAADRLLALRVTLQNADGLYRAIKGDQQRVSDEVQAAAHRCAEDAWLESVHFEISKSKDNAVLPAEALAGLDLDSALATLQSDPYLRAAAKSIIAEIVEKIPRGVYAEDAALGDSLDVLLNDARSLVLGRMSGR